MTDSTPNPEQQELITETEGVQVVDAGPGTGKTFALTRRYANIVNQPGVEPEDIFLVTFTRNAATEMKERIVNHSSYELRKLADAPINTFHGYCNTILGEHGYRAPEHLGIDKGITHSTRIVENELEEKILFEEFFSTFKQRHPEYIDYYRILDDETTLLDIISNLAAKGVFPTNSGWYRYGEKHLEGDFEAFLNDFEEVNEPRSGGSIQSKLRKKLSRYGRNKTYHPDAPEKTEVRGAGKSIPSEVAERIFHENREELKSFVHDIYFEYIEFALGRNYLNFGFLQLFTYVLLMEDSEVRDSLSFEYVMVDEFQDSSEIQFKLALLLLDTDNLCVVGDWKQSIYSFQYAEVENIQRFKQRIDTFKDQLNRDEKRVTLDTDSINRISLEKNYRSTESIIRFSENSLTVPGSKKEDVDQDVMDEVIELSPDKDIDNSVIEGAVHGEEHEAVVSKIQEIVGNPEYRVKGEDGELRRPTYSDITVLTRTRDYGRDLVEKAFESGVPVSYDGGIEIFRTDAAKILLAWLRILEYDADRGWALVLEQAGYGIDEINHLLESNGKCNEEVFDTTGKCNEEVYPEDMLEFKKELSRSESVASIARKVFNRYQLAGAVTGELQSLVSSLYSNSSFVLGDIIRVLERGIEDGAIHEVNSGAGVDSVSVQTIHSVKGLEYPIVILANMNQNRFPSTGGGRSNIFYDETLGLRQRKEYHEVENYPHIYDKWRYDIYRHCSPTNYDEERRLLYVGITRAEHHVCLVGGEEPSKFLEELPVEVREMEVDLATTEELQDKEEEKGSFEIETEKEVKKLSPHSLMDTDVFSEGDSGSEAESIDIDETVGDETVGSKDGVEFGSRVHEFAENYALDHEVKPSNPDEQNVKEFIDGLDGELHVEISVFLPLEVDSERFCINGVVDLVHEKPDEIEIYDYKTDRSKKAVEEYRKQLSVYHHVLDGFHDEKKVSSFVFYTEKGELDEVDPLMIDELRQDILEAGGDNTSRRG